MLYMLQTCKKREDYQDRGYEINLARTIFLFLLCFTFSCDNQYRTVGSAASTESQSSDTSSLVGLSKDAYQVTEEEYDNYFVSRYGLLHQKFSDSSFYRENRYHNGGWFRELCGIRRIMETR